MACTPPSAAGAGWATAVADSDDGSGTTMPLVVANMTAVAGLFLLVAWSVLGLQERFRGNRLGRRPLVMQFVVLAALVAMASCAVSSTGCAGCGSSGWWRSTWSSHGC